MISASEIRIRASLSSVFFVIALVPPLLLRASPVHAQMLICKSHSTDSHDHEHLRAAILKVLPADVPLTGGLPEVCRNRGSAHAWLTTSPRLTSDGVTEWWDVNCSRGSQQWACDPPAHRQLIWVYADVDGILRRLEVSFDDVTGLARARTLAVRAMHIIQDLAAEPPRECGSHGSAEDARRDWEKTGRRYRLKPEDTAIELSVESTDRGAFEVLTNGLFGLRFNDPGDEPLSSEVCWGQWIVVT
jgi:hypothetical protein